MMIHMLQVSEVWLVSRVARCVFDHTEKFTDSEATPETISKDNTEVPRSDLAASLRQAPQAPS